MQLKGYIFRNSFEVTIVVPLFVLLHLDLYQEGINFEFLLVNRSQNL